MFLKFLDVPFLGFDEMFLDSQVFRRHYWIVIFVFASVVECDRRTEVQNREGVDRSKIVQCPQNNNISLNIVNYRCFAMHDAYC